MSRRELGTMADVAAALESIETAMSNEAKLTQERRKVDDEREKKADLRTAELIQRIDNHGLRTTAIETKWEAFFGDQGAFKIFVKNIEDLSRKSDKQAILLAIGIGIIITLQFLLKR